MDESTRIIIAYAELIVGFPLLVAKIIWFVPSVILTKALGMIAERLDLIVDAIIEGMIAVLAACLVFDHFQLRTAWAVPVTLMIVNCLWNWAKEEAFRAWASALGIICGFLLYPNFMTHFVVKYGFTALLYS